jgi:hypothetical protein
MSLPRVLLLTGNQLRHRYVAHQLSVTVNLAGILVEAKQTGIAAALGGEMDLIADHFQQRDQVELSLLPQHAEFPPVSVREVPNGCLNRMENYQWAQALRPDVVVLFGTGLVRPPVVDLCPGGMVNLHLGLSPWYRGAGTNFWPFVFEQPECVGATIHTVVAKVDAGPILSQVRPQWSQGDGMHEAGTKTLMAAVEELVRMLPGLAARSISGEAQNLSTGRVFRQKDFDAAALQRARKNLRSGMIEQYLENRDQRNAAFPMVQAPALSGMAVA